LGVGRNFGFVLQDALKAKSRTIEEAQLL